MQRVDTATAVEVLPAQNAPGDPGYFTQGNPAEGLAATIPGQDWFNCVQEELIAVILAAGLTPDKAATNQVLTAIQRISVPYGAEMLWPKETPPTGWLEEDGASLVRATYPDLFAAIGTMYGAADGTHFNLPDARGKFPRAWAHGQTTDPDRATRTAPTATGATVAAGDHVGTNQEGQVQLHNHAITVYSTGDGSDAVRGSLGSGTPVNRATLNIGGNETRPINTYRMMIMKAY